MKKVNHRLVRTIVTQREWQLCLSRVHFGDEK